MEINLFNLRKEFDSIEYKKYKNQNKNFKIISYGLGIVNFILGCIFIYCYFNTSIPNLDFFINVIAVLTCLLYFINTQVSKFIINKMNLSNVKKFFLAQKNKDEIYKPIAYILCLWFLTMDGYIFKSIAFMAFINEFNLYLLSFILLKNKNFEEYDKELKEYIFSVEEEKERKNKFLKITLV